MKAEKQKWISNDKENKKRAVERKFMESSYWLLTDSLYYLVSQSDIATKTTDAVVKINDRNEESSFQNLERQVSV